MAGPAKRARTRGTNGEAIANLPNSPLAKLPLELLADVLSYMRSTRDVLALARSSKHFFSILVDNPATVFIWRQARERCVLGALPEPLPGMSEATFAALIYDTGVCESCGKRTHSHYYSFSLRARLCEDTKKCLTPWVASHLHEVTPEEEIEYPDILQWIPRMERKDAPYLGKIFVRTDAWLKAIDERKKAYLLGPDAISAYTETKQVLADALPAKMEIYRKLVDWGKIQDNGRRLYSEVGISTADMHSQQIGCTRWELLQSPTYSSIHYPKLRCFERWLQSEFDVIKDTVLAEIAAQKQKQIVREQEIALQKKRSEATAEYARLREADPKAILPSLPEFHQLSVVRTVESSATAKNANFKDPFVTSLLKDNLDQWRASARAALAAVLGSPGWKNINKKKLHPVDRLTARFRCKRCDAAGKHKPEDGGLDFARACEHVCTSLSKKARSKHRWSADDFVPDQRAIDAVSQVLVLCGTKPEQADSVTIADSVGDRVQCTTCSLNMDVRSVARHCKRHEECSFVLLPGTDVSVGGTIEHGLAATLLQQNSESATRRDQKVYACRHCRSAPSNGQGPAVQTQHRLKLMTFNGLRSHLKEKHGVEWIADEDFSLQKDSATSNDDHS